MIDKNKNWVKDELKKGGKVSAGWLLAGSTITAEVMAGRI